MRGMLKVPVGAAVCGIETGPEAERTPPVRRPERSEARGLGAAVVIVLGGRSGRLIGCFVQERRYRRNQETLTLCGLWDCVREKDELSLV
jgi:hypothetical protein